MTCINGCLHMTQFDLRDHTYPSLDPQSAVPGVVKKSHTKKMLFEGRQIPISMVEEFLQHWRNHGLHAIDSANKLTL